jgi:hypothetical protein
MEVLGTLLLILKHFKYVVQLVKMIEKYTSAGIKERDLERGLHRLEKGFADVTTIQETADAAADINDSFRR